MASESATVRLAEALAERGALLPASVPVTETLSNTALAAVEVQGQVNAAEPVSAARSALGGETAPHVTAPVMERAEGVTAFTAAAPELPTCSTRLNPWPRSTNGATLNEADRLWMATGGLVTDPAVIETPEFW